MDLKPLLSSEIGLDSSLTYASDPKRIPKLLSVEEYERLERVISPLLPKNSIMGPGSGFGPLIGSVVGKLKGFAWVNPWTLLIDRESYSSLHAMEINLPEAIPAKLRFRLKHAVDVLEFQLLPLARLSPESFQTRELNICPNCKLDRRKLLLEIIDESTIPKKLDIFRNRDHPTSVLATEKFIEAITIRNFVNISYNSLETS